MSGVRAPIAAAVADAAAASAAAEGEQLDFLPPTRFAPSDTDSRHGQLVEAVRRDRAGRPPGARNLVNRDALDFVRKTLGDPMIDRARWLQHTPETLARELGCTKLEAFDRLDGIRQDLSKLFYAPLAAVDGQGNAVVPTFNLSIGGAPRGGPGARAPWEYLADESQQNQPLIEQAKTVSHEPVSHEDDK